MQYFPSKIWFLSNSTNHHSPNMTGEITPIITGQHPQYFMILWGIPSWIIPAVSTRNQQIRTSLRPDQPVKFDDFRFMINGYQ